MFTPALPYTPVFQQRFCVCGLRCMAAAASSSAAVLADDEVRPWGDACWDAKVKKNPLTLQC